MGSKENMSAWDPHRFQARGHPLGIRRARDFAVGFPAGV